MRTLSRHQTWTETQGHLPKTVPCSKKVHDVSKNLLVRKVQRHFFCAHRHLFCGFVSLSLPLQPPLTMWLSLAVSIFITCLSTVYGDDSTNSTEPQSNLRIPKFNYDVAFEDGNLTVTLSWWIWMLIGIVSVVASCIFCACCPLHYALFCHSQRKKRSILQTRKVKELSESKREVTAENKKLAQDAKKARKEMERIEKMQQQIENDNASLASENRSLASENKRLAAERNKMEKERRRVEEDNMSLASENKSLKAISKEKKARYKEKSRIERDNISLAHENKSLKAAVKEGQKVADESNSVVKKKKKKSSKKKVADDPDSDGTSIISKLSWFGDAV